MSNDTREQILHAALKLFLLHGYRASVDAIAADAGVAKQTLYNHFGSKEALFSATISAALQPLTISLAAAENDLRAGLVHFAQALRHIFLSPEAIALHRILVAESPRFPEAAREVYFAGLGSMQRQLAAVLSHAMQAGQLRRNDPDFASDMLMSMLTGQDRVKRLFGIEPEQEHPDDRAQRIVDLFLRALAPTCNGPHPNNENAS